MRGNPPWSLGMLRPLPARSFAQRFSHFLSVLAFVASVLMGFASPVALAADAEPIVFGAYLSLTGPTATFGQTTKAGIDLAVKQRNEAGGVKGRPVKVIIYDNQGKTQETGTVVTRLVTSDKVIAVIGEVASTQSLAGAPICQKFGVPMISPSSTNPKVTEVGDMIFRVCIIDPEQGYAGARFAVDHLKAKTAAILYDQKQAYSTGLAKNFKEWFTKLGGKIVAEQAYGSGTADFSAQLSNIKTTNPDVLYVPGYYTEVGNIAQQARRRGITVPMLGGDGWESPRLAEIGGKAIEGSYFTNHYAPEDQRPESQKFVEAYKKAYGEPPAALAALGYDAALVLFDAIERSPSLGGKDLAKAIAATKNFPGATGNTTIDAQRNATKPIVILQVKGGHAQYVTTIEPPK